jgi:AraC family transcriptional activator of mtrCDE
MRFVIEDISLAPGHIALVTLPGRRREGCDRGAKRNAEGREMPRRGTEFPSGRADGEIGFQHDLLHPWDRRSEHRWQKDAAGGGQSTAPAGAAVSVTYAVTLMLLSSERRDYMLIRLTHGALMSAPSPLVDWLSSLVDMMPVRGRLDLRCAYGAPWRIDQPRSEPGEIPYHAVLSGSAVLEDPTSGPPQRLLAGDILLLLQGSAHVLHDGSGAPPIPARSRTGLNVTTSENAGTGERLDMLCGHFVLTPPHHRFLRDYLPARLVVGAADRDATMAPAGTEARLARLVALMRSESSGDTLGGRAMLNALSTALFALALRLASEAIEAPMGLLAIVGHPRLAPALTAMFNEPARAWSLPEMARLCNMSRATFARHFQEHLGRSASELLTDIRMTLAANELRKPGMSTTAVAAAVGYQSEAAFQRVFNQRMGQTPAHWRRASGAPPGR